MPLQAVEQRLAREVFYRRYIDAEDDDRKSKSAQKSAFKRALNILVNSRILGGQKDSQGNAVLWFAKDEMRVER